MPALLRLVATAIALVAAALPAVAAALPATLRDTGLYADASHERVADGVIAFAPQYALWSDGTRKQRWLWLPRGSFVDASNPDAWRFPRGTKLWKEFAYGARVETRYMTLGADGRWSFATYLWTSDGSDALLAAERGDAALPVPDAPGGRYGIPSRADCTTCHGGARAPVLGFAALQLGDALPDLVRRGVVRRGPAAWRSDAPVLIAATDIERAARGHLHGNCGHCHHASGAPVPLLLAQDVGGTAAPSLDSLAAALRRMGTRNPLQQMPPLGTRAIDRDGLDKLQAWIDELMASTPDPRKEP